MRKRNLTSKNSRVTTIVNKQHTRKGASKLRRQAPKRDTRRPRKKRTDWQWWATFLFLRVGAMLLRNSGTLRQWAEWVMSRH
jgi:fatty acid desaturase